MKPLDGIKIIDLSTLLPGPMATLILADAGAEVIKIEKPGGEDMRRSPPFIEGESILFGLLNKGKRSIELDIKSKAGYNKIINLLECTYDHGIINYDTAPLYGKGYAEIILGNFLKNKKNINISTKFGLGENFKPNSFLTKPLLKLNGLKNLITKNIT